MIRPPRFLPALLSVGLALSAAQGAAAQSLNDLANQLLRPQVPDRDAAGRDAYERGRADAYRDQRDRGYDRGDNRGDDRGRDDVRGRDDRRRADEDRRRQFDDDQRRRADFDRDRTDEGRARQQGYGR